MARDFKIRPTVNGTNVVIATDVSTATPVAVGVDSGAAAGTSQTRANEDHEHQVATYASAPPADGVASAGTSGTPPSRGNHSHGVSFVSMAKWQDF